MTVSNSLYLVLVVAMVTGQVTLCLEGVEKSQQLKIYRFFSIFRGLLADADSENHIITNGFLVGENKMNLRPRTSWATSWDVVNRLNVFLVSSPTAVMME